MNLYEVEFEGICPVGNCLIIKANNLKEAKMIASKTIAHTVFALGAVAAYLHQSSIYKQHFNEQPK